MGDIRRDFEDDDDDDFSDFDFGDEEPSAAPSGGDFDFGGEDEGEFAFDEGDIDLGEDIPELEEVEGEREGGISRPFLIIAALMILLFVGGLIVVVLLSVNQGPDPFALTSTAIKLTNDAVEVALHMTETQSFFVAGTGTAIAQLPTNTPTFTPSPRPPTITPTPTLDATAQQATLLAAQPLTETAAALTQAAAAPPTQSIEDVQLTATALALLLQQGGGPSPTQELTPGTPAAPRPTALPQTGFFEDLAASGNSSVSLLALMALGLVGVIVVSRRLRTANNR